MNRTLYDTSIPGITICPPVREPGPNDVLLGYELADDHPDTCLGGAFHTSPKPGKMNGVGWFSTIGLFLCFFPLGCVPCFMKCSYNTHVQRPVYGPPPAQVAKSAQVHPPTQEQPPAQVQPPAQAQPVGVVPAKTP
jgi:hypothetical protein